jgi:hypothetical protein
MSNFTPPRFTESPHLSCPFLKLMTNLGRSIAVMCRHAGLS